MRTMLTAAALAAVTLCACERPTDGSATAHIDRGTAGGPASGLWRQRIADSRGVTETRYCLDAGAAKSLTALDAQLLQGCARRDEARAADGSWHFVTWCGAKGAEVRTEGSMSGNFHTRYVIEAESRDAAGAPAGRVRAKIERVGDCPRAMRPGDLILPGGRRTSIAALAARS